MAQSDWEVQDRGSRTKIVGIAKPIVATEAREHRVAEEGAIPEGAG